VAGVGLILLNDVRWAAFHSTS